MCNAGQAQQAARDGSTSIDVDIVGMEDHDDADSQLALLGTLCLSVFWFSTFCVHAASQCLSIDSAHAVNAQDCAVRKQVLTFLFGFDETSITHL